MLCSIEILNIFQISCSSFKSQYIYIFIQSKQFFFIHKKIPQYLELRKIKVYKISNFPYIQDINTNLHFSKTSSNLIPLYTLLHIKNAF